MKLSIRRHRELRGDTLCSRSSIILRLSPWEQRHRHAQATKNPNDRRSCCDKGRRRIRSQPSHDENWVPQIDPWLAPDEGIATQDFPMTCEGDGRRMEMQAEKWQRKQHLLDPCRSPSTKFAPCNQSSKRMCKKCFCHNLKGLRYIRFHQRLQFLKRLFLQPFLRAIMTHIRKKDVAIVKTWLLEVVVPQQNWLCGP